MVFFVDQKTKTIVDQMLETAVDPEKKATVAQRRAWALVRILRKAKKA